MDTRVTFPLIVIATRNPHKLAELRIMFGMPQELLHSVADYPGAPDPEETGLTFEDNALIKARAIRDFTGEWAIADDSGLEVDALNGEPGVYSARYAGNHGDDAANNRLLLEKMAPLKFPRSAHFSCVIALVSPDGREYTATGTCPGTILHEGHGHNGFGYDPLFLPDGQDKTFAELPSEVKCTISHRAAAAAEMRKVMTDIFKTDSNRTNIHTNKGKTMDETNAVNKTPARSKLQVKLLNLAGVLLLVAAAALYWHDMKQNKKQAAAAQIVRMCASTPLAAMGLMLDSTGTARNAYMLCPPDMATNIVAMLMKAEPTRFPKGMVEGDEYQIFMMFTNRTHTLMRAVRLYDDPENMYVGIQQPVKFNAEKKPIAWDYTPPAMVMNLGTLFEKLAKENVPQLRQRAPEFEAAMTNIINQAAQQKANAEGTNHVESTTGALQAWMAVTNAPETQAEQPQ